MDQQPRTQPKDRWALFKPRKRDSPKPDKSTESSSLQKVETTADRDFDTERTVARHQKAYELLSSCLPKSDQDDSWNFLDSSQLESDNGTFDDRFVQKVNQILESKKGRIKDRGSWYKFCRTVECTIAALIPLSKNLLAIANPGHGLNPYGILFTGLLVLINIAEKEIGRKSEILQTLDYICQQFGHLKMVKSVPSDIGEDDRSRLTNRAMDVRSACMLCLASQIRHDKTWLGTIGKVVKTFFAGDGTITDATTCLEKSVDHYRQAIESTSLVIELNSKVASEIPHQIETGEALRSNPKYLCIPNWCQKNPHFTGRTALLHRIREKLCEETPKEFNHRLALFGMGGVGKTQIAIEYVVQFEAQYEGIYWITAENSALLLSGFVSIANETGCTETTSRSQSEIATAVLNWLYRTKDWLLVVDNLDDISIANGYLPRLKTGGGHVLITTRNPNSVNIPAEGLQIEVHSPDDGKELLLRRIGLSDEIGTGSATEVEALEIVRSLGFLALAIEQAAAYIREELAKDLFQFQSIYSTQRRQFFDRETTGNTYYKNNVATTWLMSMNVVENQNPRARQLLRLFAFMNPDGITLDFLRASRNVLSHMLQCNDSAAFDADLAKALSDLVRFSLIFRPSSDVVRIHRLVQSVIKDRLSTDELDYHLFMICEVGLCSFPFFTHELRTTCRKYESEIVTIIFELGKSSTERTALLLSRVGIYFQEDGKSKESAGLLLSARDTLIRMKGPEHPDTLWTIQSLAISYRSLGRVKEAAEMQEKVLEARCRIQGQEHPDTLSTMQNLAISYQSLGQVKEAAEMQEKVLEARCRILGQEHPDSLQEKKNLAIMYRSLGRLEEAARLELDLSRHEGDLNHVR